MSWNHRILAHEDHKKEIYLVIHDVYYNEKNIPDGYSENGVTIGGETLKDIKWTLSKMKECLKKPILYAGDRFPQEFK